MKKFLSTVLLFTFYFLLFTSPVSGQQPSNSAGINIDPTNPGGRPSATDLKALGANWVRFVYKPNSAFNYNSYIGELNQAGIKITLILNQETLWPGSGINTNYINQFAQNAAQFANQFGNQVSAYEIWNEQDVPGQPTSMYIPPATYASLLTAAYNAIKTENDTLRVISGGLASGNLSYLQQVIQAAGGLPADGVGLHPYLTNIQQIQQLISGFLAISQNKPIWVTEIGWQTPNQQQQANFLRDFYQLMAQFGNQVSTAMWYAWSDSMNPGFGLIDANGDPKLAFLHFQQYAALLQTLLPNFKFLPFAVPSTFGTCQAEQPFPGGAETKGESFTVRVASCFGPADPAQAVDALLKATKLDFPHNKQIADELEEPLDNLKPAGYNPQVSQRTALGKITYDVCEEGTTRWYVVEKDVEFKTPAWLEKMATESKELASWLAPDGGQGAVMGEQTTYNKQLTTNNFLAQGPQEAGGIPHGCKYFYADSYADCSCMAKGTCRGEHGCCPNHWWWGICGWEDCQPQVRCSVGQLSNACPGEFFGGPLPTPTPRICQRYNPSGNDVAPEVVCVGGGCQIKGLARPGFITQIIDGVAQTICPGKTFLVTPKVRTPFAQSADTFLRDQTLSVFKVNGPDAEEAFEFEHALEDSQHEFSASPPLTGSSQTEIYGQRGVKDSYDWVQDALTPAGY